MLVHGIDLIVQPCIRNVAGAIRVRDNVKIDIYRDRAVRVNSRSIVRTATAASTLSAECTAMLRSVPINFIHFDTIDVPRAAFAPGVDERLSRFENNSVRSYNSAVRPD